MTVLLRQRGDDHLGLTGDEPHGRCALRLGEEDLEETAGVEVQPHGAMPSVGALALQ